MNKSLFDAIVAGLRAKKNRMTKHRPAGKGGTKFRRACDQNDKRRGADGTMR